MIDGDTIVVGGQHWRLYGIDAPPISAGRCPVENHAGLRAKAVLEQLIAEGGANGTLHVEILKLHEKYQRHLVRIFVNGKDVGESLKELKLANTYDGTGPKPRFCDCADAKLMYDLKMDLFLKHAGKRRQQSQDTTPSRP